MFNDYNESVHFLLNNTVKDISRSLIIGAIVVPLMTISPIDINSDISQSQMKMVGFSKFNNINCSYTQHFSLNISPTAQINEYAEMIFGKMRNATEKEKNFVYESLLKISKPTGVNIFNI